MPGLISFRAPPIRDEVEETWRRTMQSLLINQPSSHASDLLFQLYRLVKVNKYTNLFLSLPFCLACSLSLSLPPTAF